MKNIKSGIALEKNRTGNIAALYHSHALFIGGFFLFSGDCARRRDAIHPEDIPIWRGITNRNAASTHGESDGDGGYQNNGYHS